MVSCTNFPKNGTKSTEIKEKDRSP